MYFDNLFDNAFVTMQISHSPASHRIRLGKTKKPNSSFSKLRNLCQTEYFLIILKKKIGDKISKGETILAGYTNKPSAIEAASDQLFGAVTIANTKPEAVHLVSHIIDKKGSRAFEL
jgi:hypothetical protein